MQVTPTLGPGPLPWEAWTSILTGVLAVATWVLVFVTRSLVTRAQRDAQAQIAAMQRIADDQVRAAQDAAQRQVDATKEMAQAQVAALEEESRTRLLLHYEANWDSPAIIEHRQQLSRLLLDHYEGGGTFPYRDIQDAVPNFFESLGIFLRRSHLDLEMLWHVFGYYALRYGQLLGEYWVLDRRAQDDDRLWEGFEHLYRTLKDYQRTKTGRTADVPNEKLKEFLNDEIWLEFWKSPSFRPPS